MTSNDRLARSLPRLTDGLRSEYEHRGFWRDQLIDEAVSASAAQHPDQPGAVDRHGPVSYAELDARIDRFAAALLHHGLRSQEIVSFQLPNWTSALVVHHGIIRAGGISNPIIPIYRGRELEFILHQAASRFAVVPTTFRRFDFAALYERLQTGIESLEQVWTVDDEQRGSFDRLMETAWEQEQGARLRQVERTANDPVVLLYTSGTTADPKGVLHTHNTLDYENRTIIELMELTTDDVVFMPSPVTHITGVLYGLQLPSMLGSKVVLQDIWDPTQALELLQRERCSFTVGATPFLHSLTYHPALEDYDVSSMRVFACGGADVPPQLIIDASERICAAMRVYGSTEYPTLTASGPRAEVDRRAHTDGHIIADAEGGIVDLDGNPAPAGTVGELHVRGPEMFLGYLDAESNPFDADGWFATGDLAVLDAAGYLEIKGRKKDVIIRGGENISAKEVEDLLFTHPKVHEVAVVAYPDPVMTERACAIVVPEPDATLTLDELVSFLMDHELSIQKCPERLEIVDELPKTASGKIQKYRLRESLPTQGGI